uniref:Thioredoxin n=1 Tax=Pithovirus LCPAC101 TaxID=2506586 RepID=A0A481Z2I1_9VIRU|nr:MAG: hypothetical protein LCPAC101_01760 [Pithovirus LCPAC101]
MEYELMFILVHGGDHHEPSNEIRNYIQSKNVTGLIELSSESIEVYNYLKQINIQYLPTIIIKRGEEIQEKDATKKNVQDIIDQLKEIFNH